MTQLITVDTRVSNNCSSLLDHVYFSDTIKVASSGVIRYGISDHDLIFVILKKNLPKKDKISFSCRNIREYTIDRLSEVINCRDWELFLNSADPNVCWEIMYDNYLLSLNEIALMIEMQNVRDSEPWANSELLKLLRERDAFKHRLVESEYKNENLIKEFNQKRNEARRKVIKSKRDHVLNKIKSKESSPKKYWSELNCVMPVGKKGIEKTKNIINWTDEQGNEVPHDHTADYINRFFLQNWT